VITDRYPGFVRHQLIELGYLHSAHGSSNESVAFNIQPRKTGQMLIGSSRQYDAEGAEVDTAILARMLRRAAEYSSAGLRHLLQSIETGMAAAQMAEIWKAAAYAEAKRRGEPAPESAWSYISVAGDGFLPGEAARDGDLLKIDVGCVLSGYSSDGGRTAVLGTPHPDAVRIYDALHRAFDAGFDLLRPGTALADIYRVTSTTMWDQGFETYGRGHFGHGVGASIWSEEWPFISADSDAVLEPNMVLAFETPWYIDGLGGFIIEDQVLITDRGCDVMAPLPRELTRIS